MRKIVIILSLVIFVGGGVSSYGGTGTKKSETRDSSGKLLYRTTTKGDRSEIRDPRGKLMMRTRTSGGNTEIRNPSGKLIERVKKTK